ncbi:MAG: SH3 domain-containing protein [Candidatus Ozemobacteraceae bacterium]
MCFRTPFFILFLCFGFIFSGETPVIGLSLDAVLESHDPNNNQKSGLQCTTATTNNTSEENTSKTGTVNVSTSLNVRLAPWGKIIGKLKKGDKVTITGKSGEWYIISYNGKKAYVHSHYIKLDGTSSDSGAASSGSSDPSGSSGSSGSTTKSGTTVSQTGSGGKALLGWLQEAGLSGEKLRLAWAIGMGESRGDPKQFNGNTKTGDQSYGLFQINMIGKMGPARRKQYNLNSNDELFDPQVNIRVMLTMSKNGTKWTDWSAYKNGSYRKFYNSYPPK